jgi:hypothetical protein
MGCSKQSNMYTRKLEFHQVIRKELHVNKCKHQLRSEGRLASNSLLRKQHTCKINICPRELSINKTKKR